MDQQLGWWHPWYAFWDAADAWVETEAFQDAKGWFIVGCLGVAVLVMAVQEWHHRKGPPGAPSA